MRIGAGTSVGPHCVIEGRTTIGRDNRIFQFNSIGGEPQDKKYAGEDDRARDRRPQHDPRVLHDLDSAPSRTPARRDRRRQLDHEQRPHRARLPVVGSHTIIASYAGLAGHVALGDWAIVGAQSGLHQFVKMGAHAMCGFQSHVSQDVPPYMMVDGNPLAVRGFNVEGLRRRGFDAARIAAVKQMHRLLYREGLPLEEARRRIAALAAATPEAAADFALMTGFLAAATRGIAR